MSSVIGATSGSGSSQSTSSTSSTVQNGRYWGLASGLDVDSIVTAMVSGQQSQIDKANQQVQSLQWKQAAYQSIVSSLNTFASSYLDILATGSITSSKTYNTFSAASDVSGVSVMTTADVTVASPHTMTVYQNATAATITGNLAHPEIAGLLDSNETTAAQLHSHLDGTSFNVTVDGVTKTISFSSSDTYTDRKSLGDAIQDKINTAMGIDKVAVSIDDSGNISIGSNGAYTTSISISSTGDNTITGGTSLSSITGNDTLTVDDKNAALKAIFSGTQLTMTVDGNTQTIQFNPDDVYYGTASDFKSLLQSKLDTAFGPGMVKADINSAGQVTFQSGGQDAASISVNGSSSAAGVLGLTSNDRIADSLTALGIQSGDANHLVLNDTLKQEFGSDFGASNNGNFSVSINGVSIALNTSDSINSVMTKINASKAGVIASYSSTTGQITIQSSDTGSASAVTLDDSYTKPDGTKASRGLFSDLLGGSTSTTAQGRDAIFDFDGNSYTRSTNSFTIDGLNLQINATLKKGDTPVVSDITMSKDVGSTVKALTDFVNAYNTLVTSINKQITTKPDSNYAPLTDAQKSQMSDTDITNWNNKAQAGILFGDTTLNSMLNSMQKMIYQPVTTSSGKSISLFDVGITTSPDYTQGGTLQIDTDKLTEALQNDPDSVRQLFTNTSDIMYDVGGGPEQNLRMKQEGLGNRLQDIVNNATKTGVYPYVGSLIAIAGTPSDTSTDYELNKELSDLNEKITDYKQQLTDRKNQLYNQFTQLETYMEQMNSQSSMISSFGSGS